MTEEFPVSLQTFLIHTNVWMDDENRSKLFTRLQDYEVKESEIRFKRKRMEPHIKTINVPVGRIFGMSCMGEHWGVTKQLNMDKTSDDKLMQDMLNGVHEETGSFKNALCIYMSMPNNNIHIMRFCDIIKIAGCNNEEECVLAVSLLWRHIEPHDDCYVVMHEDDKDPSIIEHVFNPTMINYNFTSDYTIDRDRFLDKLNTDMKDVLSSSWWHETQNNVLAEFHQKRHPDEEYKSLVFRKGHLENAIMFIRTYEEMKAVTELIYAYNPNASKKNNKSIKPIRVKINRTSTIMATGRYHRSILDICARLKALVEKNKDELREVIRPCTDIDDDFDISNFIVS